MSLFKDSCNYSIFSDLGDLSFYKLEELKALATSFNTSYEYLSNEVLTTWAIKQTKYEILYTLSGSFIKIKSKTWFRPFLTVNK